MPPASLTSPTASWFALPCAPGGTAEDFIFSISWYPLFGLNGEVEGIITATLNLTEQVRSEADMHDREARDRSLFETIDEGFGIIEMLYDEAGRPADYRFREANEAFFAHTGMPEDVIGKTALEVFPTLERHWIDTYGQVADTGEAVRFENEAKAMGRWFEVYAFRIGNPARREVALLFKDVAQRKRAEIELRDSERRALASALAAQAERSRVDALLQAAPAGIVVTDAEGKIIQSNAAHRRMWGETSGSEPAGMRRGWWADGSARQGSRWRRMTG